MAWARRYSKKYSEAFKLYAKILRRKGSHNSLSLKEVLSETYPNFLGIRMNSSPKDSTQ